jgi:signal recognition particle GTPase
MPVEDLQKWIDASVKATQLKFALEDILTKGFTTEDMQSVKYKQLLGTVDQYLEHIMGEYRKEKEDKIKNHYEEELEKIQKLVEKLKKENERLKKSSSIWNMKSATIASVGALVLELVKFIVSAIRGA